MKSDQWKTYRTRFLVQAKQLQSSLTFVDHLGRQHCGRKGDYLVESSDGVLSIAPRRIFEDIYVLMCPDSADPESTRQNESGDSAPDAGRLARLSFEPLRIQEVKLPDNKIPNAKLHDARPRTSVRGRKQPQPVRERNPSSSHLSLM